MNHSLLLDLFDPAKEIKLRNNVYDYHHNDVLLSIKHLQMTLWLLWDLEDPTDTKVIQKSVPALTIITGSSSAHEV